MTHQWTGIFGVILAYLLGAIPFGYLFVRLKQGMDIRAVGSGNIGATNVLRAVIMELERRFRVVVEQMNIRRSRPRRRDSG